MNLLVRKCEKDDIDNILARCESRDADKKGLLRPREFKRAIQKIDKVSLSTYDLDNIFDGADPERINYRQFIE